METRATRRSLFLAFSFDISNNTVSFHSFSTSFFIILFINIFFKSSVVSNSSHTHVAYFGFLIADVLDSIFANTLTVIFYYSSK